MIGVLGWQAERSRGDRDDRREKSTRWLGMIFNEGGMFEVLANVDEN